MCCSDFLCVIFNTFLFAGLLHIEFMLFSRTVLVLVTNSECPLLAEYSGSHLRNQIIH